jgi:hypothetical protein
MSQENELVAEYNKLAAKQRAGLLAILYSIFDEKLDLDSVKDVKMMVLHAMSSMIDKELMVGDTIEKMVLQKMMDYAETESAVEDAKDLINSTDSKD